jgi:hypothetical protein
MSTFCKLLLVLASLLYLGGCASSIDIVPLSETAKKESVGKGAPYYLPMPCMLITKNIPISTVIPDQSNPDNNASPSANGSENPKGSKGMSLNKKNKKPVDKLSSGEDHYEFQILYLPDLDRQYGIKMRGGIGSFEGDVKLQDGWKLTGLNVKSDSRTDEIIKASGDFLTNAAAAALQLSDQPDSLQTQNKEQPNAEMWIYKLKKNYKWELLFHWPGVTN